jgi:hypothetical protein
MIFTAHTLRRWWTIELFVQRIKHELVQLSKGPAGLFDEFLFAHFLASKSHQQTNELEFNTDTGAYGGQHAHPASSK